VIFCPNMRKRQTTAGRPRTVDPTGRAAGSRKVAAWVTDAQYEALRRRAAQNGVSISELVRQALAS
jgi:Ribbon-helix-helix protein, copG family